MFMEWLRAMWSRAVRLSVAWPALTAAAAAAAVMAAALEYMEVGGMAVPAPEESMDPTGDPTLPLLPGVPLGQPALSYCKKELKLCLVLDIMGYFQ